MFIIIFAVIWILKDNLHHFPMLVFYISMGLAIAESLLYIIIGLLAVLGFMLARRNSRELQSKRSSK